MKKRWIWLSVLAVVIVGCVAAFFRPETPPSVRTMVLTPSAVEQTVSCNGVVEAVDGIGVFAPINCQIREVRISVGQRITKGDILAVVDKEATCKEAKDPSVRIAVAAMNENIIAPADGIVTKVSVQAGETLKVGTPCAILVRPCDLRVRIAIREKDICVLREGMTVRLSGDALDQKTYPGVLSELAATAVSTGSATMVEGVVIPDEGQIDQSFRLGISAKASVITSVIEQGLLIPYEAVLADELGSYIYVLKNGAAMLERVDNAVQISRGLLLEDVSLNGATVILDPEMVRDGQMVTEAVS